MSQKERKEREKAYSLVKFWESGKVEEAVVPTKWIHKDLVYWSTSINARRDLKEQRPINPKWPSYKLIKVVISDDDYDLCCRYVFSTSEDSSPVTTKKTATRISHLESPVVKKRRLISECLSDLGNDDDDDENDEDITIEVSAGSSTPVAYLMGAEKFTRTESSNMIASSLPGASFMEEARSKHAGKVTTPTPNDLLQMNKNKKSDNPKSKKDENGVSTTKYQSGGDSFKELPNKQFQYIMMMELKKIQDNQERILALLSSENTDTLSEEILPSVPATSIEEFDATEESLEISKNRKVKRTQIKRIGGKDARASVRLALDSLFKREVQVLFSKDGVKGKRAFTKTRHYKCLLGALVEKYTKQEIDFLIGDLLKRAGRKTAEN